MLCIGEILYDSGIYLSINALSTYFENVADAEFIIDLQWYVCVVQQTSCLLV